MGKQEQPQIELIINPEELLSLNNPIAALAIDKTSKYPSLSVKKLTDKVIEASFSHLDFVTYEKLRAVSEEGINFGISQLKKQYQKNKSGISLEKFLEKAAPRHLQSQVEALLYQWQTQRIYHRIKNPQTKNYLIAKAHISSTRPKLIFEIKKDAQGNFQVCSHIDIGNERFGLEAFQQFAFLLLKESTYYILDFNSRQQLHWLQSGTIENYKNNEVLFVERVVKKLEQYHQVIKEDVFTTNEISSLPSHCIYLSELNDNMLMLTPKWDYEGIIVDLPYQPIHNTVRQGQSYTIKRDEWAETHFLAQLKTLHPNFVKQNNFHYLSFEDAKKKQWFLKTYQQLLAADVAVIGMELLRHFRYSPHAPETIFTVLDENDQGIRATMTIQFGEESLKLTAVQKLLLSGQNSILLIDHSIAVFPDEWIEQYARLIKHAKIKQNEITVSKWLAFGLKEGNVKDKMLPTITKAWQELWLRWQQSEEPIFSLPKNLKASLRPYQIKGYEWLQLLSEIGAGACLADDMGLGKTLQTIAYICRRIEQNPECKVIITCPMTLTFNWQKELEKFAPTIGVYFHNGANRSLNQYVNSNNNICIVSYGTLRNDIDEFLQYPWDVVVADESHNVKNTNALTTRAMLQLNASMRIALTGTPVLNNTSELFAQMEFLVPGLLGSLAFFKKEYAQAIDKDGDEYKMQQLQQIVSPFLLKRNKNQVATDLPEKTEEILWCAMGERQQYLYDEIKAQVRKSLFLEIENKGIGENKLNILQAILKLRRICAAPQLLEEYKEETESVKLELLMEQFALLKGKKKLVFSQFTGMLSLIANACKKQGLNYFHFDGSTPLAQRQAMVAQFQDDEDKTEIFLISLKAGNAGLNLTAAEYVFLVDPWWNQAVQQQAIDRTHRIGQTKNIFAYQMLCKGTVEEKIVLLQQKKQTIAEGLVQAEEHFVKNLSEEDIKYLFN
jgi:superfamily II DNA or RNA helicase